MLALAVTIAANQRSAGLATLSSRLCVEGLLLAGLLAIGNTLPVAQAADRPAAVAGEALERLVADIGERLDSRVAHSLSRIDGTGRRLLALRSYLRSEAKLAERWSWSQEQIAAYEGSPEHSELLAEIGKVREAFARNNPGYELWINPQVRSLDRQLESWNTNESVTEAAAGLTTAAVALVDSPSFPAQDAAKARGALETFLRSFQPTPAPTVAAPGLSPHGQMRAVDFQVQRGEAIVAGPKAATIATEWDAAGWSTKLDAAVRAASSRFVGPLASPREPWHYTYSPEAVAAQ
jgi:hypothetical protein